MWTYRKLPRLPYVGSKRHQFLSDFKLKIAAYQRERFVSEKHRI